MKEISSQKVKNYWDDSFQDKEFNYGAGYKIDDERLAKIRFMTEVKLLQKIIPDSRIAPNSLLDIGCGNGKYAFHFAAQFPKIVGIDFSSKSIELATKEAVKRNLNISFHCLDVRKINLQEKFDVIFVGGVLMYLNDADVPAVVEKLSQHLTPAGIIIFREPLFTQDKRLVKEEPYSVIYRSLQSLQGFIVNSTMEVKQIRLNPGYMYGVIIDAAHQLLKNKALIRWFDFFSDVSGVG